MTWQDTVLLLPFVTISTFYVIDNPWLRAAAITTKSGRKEFSTVVENLLWSFFCEAFVKTLNKMIDIPDPRLSLFEWGLFIFVLHSRTSPLHGDYYNIAFSLKSWYLCKPILYRWIDYSIEIGVLIFSFTPYPKICQLFLIAPWFLACSF